MTEIEHADQPVVEAPSDAARPLDVSAKEHAPAIQAVDLCRRFGRIKAIDGLTFSIQAGQIVGFLGPNGAGKSTTMRILTGLLSATSGSASVCGICVASHPEAVRERIGYMPENNPLPDDLRVIEYLRFRGKLKGLKGARLNQRIEEAMRVCDLDRKARRRLIGQLSKGFRQRVGIADAILAEPEVVIMDEPTIGLDPHQILAMRELIRQLAGRMTVVISSHILPEIEACCDSVVIINHGRVVASGTPDELRSEFVPDVRWRLCVDGPVRRLETVVGELGGGISIESASPADSAGFREFVLRGPVSDEVGERLFSQLRDRHYRVREMARIPASLEDVFLAATRRAWMESAGNFNTPSSGPSPFPDQT